MTQVPFTMQTVPSDMVRFFFIGFNLSLSMTIIVPLCIMQQPAIGLPEASRSLPCVTVG